MNSPRSNIPTGPQKGGRPLPKINEGKEKWVLNTKVKVDESKYPEALQGKRLAEYKILYESLVRYSIIPLVWCIDTIDVFNLNSKTVVGDSVSYSRNNLSFHIKKILQPLNPFPFKISLPLLTQGLDEHWRNAIAHETIEYRDNGILLRDADPKNPHQPAWECLATNAEIALKIDELCVTHYFQTTACALFGFEYEKKINWTNHRPWKTDKDLTNLIARYVEQLNLAMHPPLEINEKQIILNLKKQDSFDHPSSIYWGGPFVRGAVDIPALSFERQVFALAKYCASTKIPQQYLEVHLISFDDKEVEAFRVDVTLAEKLRACPPFEGQLEC